MKHYIGSSHKDLDQYLKAAEGEGPLLEQWTKDPFWPVHDLVIMVTVFRDQLRAIEGSVEGAQAREKHAQRETARMLAEAERLRAENALLRDLDAKSDAVREARERGYAARASSIPLPRN